MGTLCLGLALFTGAGALSLGQASAAPLSLGATINVAAPKVEFVGERRGDWWRKHGRHHRDGRHRHFHEGLWFQFPFWLGATAAPYYADSYYDDDEDDDYYGEDFYEWRHRHHAFRHHRRHHRHYRPYYGGYYAGCGYPYYGYYGYPYSPYCGGYYGGPFISFGFGF